MIPEEKYCGIRIRFATNVLGSALLFCAVFVLMVRRVYGATLGILELTTVSAACVLMIQLSGGWKWSESWEIIRQVVKAPVPRFKLSFLLYFVALVAIICAAWSTGGVWAGMCVFGCLGAVLFFAGVWLRCLQRACAGAVIILAMGLAGPWLAESLRPLTQENADWTCVEFHTVSVEVIDADTGDPVQNAEVTVKRVHGLTGDSGLATIPVRIPAFGIHGVIDRAVIDLTDLDIVIRSAGYENAGESLAALVGSSCDYYGRGVPKATVRLQPRSELFLDTD